MMSGQASPAAGLKQRFEKIKQRIEICAARCNRDVEEITVVGISKTHPVEILQHALVAGLTELGENRVQEAEPKILQLGRDVARWHLVGHLQANKARRAVGLFDLLHSLDSASLARRLDRLCIDEQRSEFHVLIQVDLAGEKTKSGVKETELPELLVALAECQRLRLIGLMTLPPFFEDLEAVRPFFRRLRELRDDLQTRGHFAEGAGELSMGMSHDFEIAIEEGATMLRIGTAIFGERSP